MGSNEWWEEGNVFVNIHNLPVSVCESPGGGAQIKKRCVLVFGSCGPFQASWMNRQADSGEEQTEEQHTYSS